MAEDGASEPDQAAGSSAAAARASLRLSHIELQGFKSFRGRVVIGPLGPFTAVVGPNGSGKSVVGEAIAFALGGSSRMLRAGSLAGLLNQQLKAAGGRSAEVVLHMELLPAGGSLCSDVAAAAPSDAAGSADTAAAPAGGAQRLSVKRVLRGDAARTFLRRPGRDEWAAVSQAQLQQELAPYGIATSAVDRFIVTQSRQAVAVADPVALVGSLQALTGLGGYREAIEAQGRELEALAGSMDATAQQVASLSAERESLAPQVAHCQRVQEMAAQLLHGRRELLADEQAHGQQQLTHQARLVAAAERAAAAAAEELQSAESKEGALQQQHGSLDAQVAAANASEAAARKQATKLSAAAASALVEHSSAAAALKNKTAAAQQLEQRVAKLLAEEAAHKQQVAACHHSLRELQELQAAAEQQLAAAREAAAAAAGSGAAQRQAEAGGADARVLAHSRRDAAAAQATQASAAVAALRRCIADADAAAADIQQQLQAAEQAADAVCVRASEAVAGVQRAEQQWREADMQLRGAQELLHQGRVKQQQQAPAGGQHPDGQHGSSTFDAAVQQLKQLSDAGRLPGTFFGRLCNVAAVPAAASAAATAVNAALQEVCSLRSMLLVSNRQTAEAVVAHFRAHRVGTAHCRILSEVSASRSSTSSGGGGVVGATPLLGSVAPQQALPELPDLLQQLLGGWLLVERRQDALQLLHLRRNLVTRAGEVFKGDGEIVVSLGGPRGNNGSSSVAYGLPVGQPLPIPAVPAAAAAASAAPAAGQQQGAAAAAAAANRAAAQRVQQLQQQEALASHAAADAEAGLTAARQAHMAAQRQAAAAERALQRARSEHAAQSERAAQLLPRLQQQLDAAVQAQQAADAAAAQAAAAADVCAARQLRSQLQGAAGGSNSKGPDGAGEAAAVAAAEQQLQEAAAAVQAAWGDADAAQRQQKRTSSRLAALQRELHKVAESPACQAQLDRLQARASSLQQQAAAADAKRDAVAAEQARLGSSLKLLKQQLAAAGRARAEAQRVCDASKAALQQHLGEQQRLQQQQEQRHAALQQLQDDVGDSAPAASGCTSDDMADAEGQRSQQQQLGEADAALAGQLQLEHMQLSAQEEAAAEAAAAVSDGDAPAPPPSRSSRRRTRATAAIVTSSSSSSSEAGSSSGNDDGEAADGRSSRRGKARAAAPRSRHSSRRSAAKKSSSAIAAPAQDAAAALAARSAALARRRAALDAQADALSAARAHVDERSVEREAALLRRLADAQAALGEQRRRHAAAASARAALLEERYARLLAVLQRLNGLLDGAYRALTDGNGSAHLAFTQERRLLFSRGVTLHVQAGDTWRPFAMLSGGQQALAALALSFALQALFPSPFTFFDEIDAALDTAAAARLAAFVHARCAGQPLTDSGGGDVGGGAGAQYLLVSHRPVVFESASCLLGVYSDGGSSAAVVGHFGGQQRGGG